MADKASELRYEEQNRIKDEIERKHGKTPEQLYQEREKRIYDALQMKVPDRVPVIFGGTFFACKYAGLPYSAAYYDAPAWKGAYKRMLLDLEPDAYGSAAVESGLVLEALDSNYTRWPGGNLPPDVGQQIVETEFMKEDEYDLFLSDPSDFIVRYWLPRVFNTMSPLAKLPPLMSIGTNVASITSLFASPEFGEFAKAMEKAGKEEVKWRQVMDDFHKEMSEFGFPQAFPGRGGVQPPFSGFTNNFRTFNGVVRDMFRQPDKLKAALEKILEYRIARATLAVRTEGKPTVGNSGEAHRVSDEILSPKQFETFVWPNWKRAIQKTIDLGYDIVSMFFEGRRDKQLEYFLEFPKGSLFIRFAETDIFRAKEILGDRACLMGNVPIQLLQMGSPQEVEEYCKKLIKTCGKDGGFILRCSTDYTQEAKPENVKAMIDSVNKYGWY
ncbi:MAG: uroporphyrinogen decarboxylase family protein [Dehalococcoidales bacterium]